MDTKFKPGNPKPPNSGRKPGTPNKVTKGLMEMCEEMGINPFLELLKDTYSDNPAVRASALREVCSYLYPKRKSIEVSGNVDLKLIERAEQLAQLPREELVKLLEKK